MFSALRTRLALIAVPVMLVTGSLAAAQPASAADYCVGNILCAPGVKLAPDLQTALDFAGLQPDADRIILGGGTYDAPDSNGWVYNSPGPVEIDGGGIGDTVLTGPGPVKQLLDLEGGPGTAIQGVSIQLPQMAALGTALFTNADVKDVAVSEQASQATTHLGVSLIGDGTLEDSSVSMYPGSQATGVALGGSATLRNSTVSARTAVMSVYGGSIQRSWLTGDDYALFARGGTTSIENSMLRVNSASGTGIGALALGSPHLVVNADGLTMFTGGFGGAHAGVHAEAYDVAGETVDISLKNSILRGFAIPAEAVATGAGAATIQTSWSDYDASKTQATGNATVSKSHISNAANPGFINPFSGNFRLAPSSPLIDAGDPATPQGLDMDGNARVTDGNLDGTARRDIGAYEVPGPLPKDPPPAEQPQSAADAGEPAAGGAAASAIAGSSNGSAADTLAPVVSGFKASNKSFAVGRARTALAAVLRGTTLRYSLSEAAKVTIKIQRARDGRAIGKLTRAARQGSNALKFSGRIGKRALKSGRYVAVLTATDAAGNRSAAKRVAFRVVTR